MHSGEAIESLKMVPLILILMSVLGRRVEFGN